MRPVATNRDAFFVEAGRAACGAPTPVSTTGPNILLVGDSITRPCSVSTRIPTTTRPSLTLSCRTDPHITESGRDESGRDGSGNRMNLETDHSPVVDVHREG